VPVAVTIAAALFVVVFVTSNDTSPPPVGAQQEREVTSEPTTVQDAPPKETGTVAEQPRSQAERIAIRVPRRATALGSPVDAAESITTFESIEPGPIEMDDVIIEPLVVEPLTN
jgi:hypothetical protein